LRSPRHEGRSSHSSGISFWFLSSDFPYNTSQMSGLAFALQSPATIG
jgi:hypothetical protein